MCASSNPPPTRESPSAELLTPARCCVPLRDRQSRRRECAAYAGGPSRSRARCRCQPRREQAGPRTRPVWQTRGQRRLAAAHEACPRPAVSCLNNLPRKHAEGVLESILSLTTTESPPRSASRSSPTGQPAARRSRFGIEPFHRGGNCRRLAVRLCPLRRFRYSAGVEFLDRTKVIAQNTLECLELFLRHLGRLLQHDPGHICVAWRRRQRSRIGVIRGGIGETLGEV